MGETALNCRLIWVMQYQSWAGDWKCYFKDVENNFCTENAFLWNLHSPSLVPLPNCRDKLRRKTNWNYQSNALKASMIGLHMKSLPGKRQQARFSPLWSMAKFAGRENCSTSCSRCSTFSSFRSHPGLTWVTSLPAISVAFLLNCNQVILNYQFQQTSKRIYCSRL